MFKRVIRIIDENTQANNFVFSQTSRRHGDAVYLFCAAERHWKWALLLAALSSLLEFSLWMLTS